MLLIPLHLPGTYLIKSEPKTDERGFFARTFCKQELSKHGIEFSCAQCNISHNEKAGTLRGMHFQRNPYQEAKIVSCTRGAIYDAIVEM